MVLVKPAEDAGCEQLAEGGTRLVEALMKGLVGAWAEELDAVGDETVDCAAESVAFQAYSRHVSCVLPTGRGVFRVV